MPDHAKIFKSGGSQAVRLPKEYRFEGQERVRINRQGRRVILESERPSWSREFLDLAGSAAEVPAWMFDQALCSRMVLRRRPHVCWEALVVLQLDVSRCLLYTTTNPSIP